MKELGKIAALLRSDAMEKQVAAAIVLGEIGAGGKAVVDGVLGMLESSAAPLQRHALDALAKLGATKFLDKIFPLLAARDQDVRTAAVRALVSVGKPVIARVRERMEAASSYERRGLETVLTQLGGEEAFSAILAGLPSLDEEGAKSVALQLRAQFKDADPKARHSLLAQLTRFLKAKKTQEAPAALAAGLRIMGYLEDAKSVPVLLGYAGGSKQPANVRVEAVTALRVARTSEALVGRVAPLLLKLAEGDEQDLARAALLTVGALPLKPALAARYATIAAHPDLERARYAIEQLGRQEHAQAAKALVEVIATQDRVRAELAATALNGRKDAGPELVQALLKVDDPPRAQLLRRVLRTVGGGELDRKLRERLLDAAIERLSAGKAGWEAALETAREADPAGTVAALRALVEALARSKKRDQAIRIARVLSQSERASPEDRFRLAVLELLEGRHDTNSVSRSRDPALKTLLRLVGDGFDVVAALRKERALTPEAKYYIGFHFVEEGHPVGEDLLDEVAKSAGRSKIGQMARNKLELAARAEGG